MSVVIETTLGDITIDLYINDRPRACLNFFKLCKIKYYNYNLFHTISRGFMAQTGDPSGSRNGGESVYGVLDGSRKRFFEGEDEPRIKHTKMGLISFVGDDERMIGSQFFLTLGEDLTYLDEKHCVFGEVVEGFDILESINEVICDNDDRPYQDVRITHTVVLDDPFPDPRRLIVPSRSPSPSVERLKGGRIAPDEEIDEFEGKTQAEVTEMQADREAKARAAILEMVGDLPDAEMAPPENVLFVCKLNPVTTDDDLEIIFSRFGKIKSCEVIRDKKSGDSLQYAFVEFEDKAACENAYFKMDNVLIDDRRIHVDFSQSVSKVKWRGKGRGVTHFDEKGNKSRYANTDIGKGNYKHKNVKNDENKPYRETRERSRSPKSNNSTSKYERRKGDHFDDRKLRNDFDRSSRGQKKPPSASPERRRHSRSPIARKNKGRSPDREPRSSKTNREEKSPTPRRKKDSSSPSRRERDIRESQGSSRYRRASPRRKVESSPHSRRDRGGEARRNRSESPRRRSSKRNDNYSKTEKYGKENPSSSRGRSGDSESGSDKGKSEKRKYQTLSSKDANSRNNYQKEKYSERKNSKKNRSKYSSSESEDSDSDSDSTGNLKIVKNKTKKVEG